MTRVLMTLGLLVAIGGCEINKALWFAGQSALGGFAGTFGSWLANLATIIPSVNNTGN